MGVGEINMILSDLVVRLMDDNPNLTQPDIEKIVEIFLGGRASLLWRFQCIGERRAAWA